MNTESIRERFKRNFSVEKFIENGTISIEGEELLDNASRGDGTV